MGVKFAPLRVPLERRLQTLGAACWIVPLGLGELLCIGITIYLAFSPHLWLFFVPYFVWFYIDRETGFKGGRKWLLGRTLPIWKYFMTFFPISLIKTAELSPEKNYLFCIYPHGVLSAGIFGNFATNYSDAAKLFPGISFRCCTLDLHFKVPFYREYLLSLGTIASSRESIEYVLNNKNKGNACCLLIGGAAESLHARPGPYHIILNKRKGFVKIALRTGSCIVPVFSFGEIDLYDQPVATPGSRFAKFQDWYKKVTGMALVFPQGRGFFQYSFGILPRRSPISTVVGKPIEVPQIVDPSNEEIDYYHNLYKDSLIKLFEEHKKNYVSNPENTKLIIS